MFHNDEKHIEPITEYYASLLWNKFRTLSGDTSIAFHCREGKFLALLKEFYVDDFISSAHSKTNNSRIEL